jgi:tetratricopeptide (TPR) repeat protein
LGVLRPALLAILCVALAAPASAARRPAAKKTPPAAQKKKQPPARQPVAEPQDSADDGAGPAEPAAPARPPPPVDPKVQALFDALAGARDAAGRKQAIDAILKLDPIPVQDVVGVLGRTRKSTDADRRALLLARGFDVPDAKGKFSSPGRQTDKAEKANDELDWLAPFQGAPASPAVADVVLDLAAIRALAASKVTAGATGILEFAFTPDGIAYRDECGRFLRKMSPWSLPALILGAESRKSDRSLARYAKYQLERLDRENPRKALNDAPTDALEIEILKAFSDSQYREAVFTVLDTVDHPAPAIRKAARDAWMEYATGRPPRPVPKEKLMLPGGKLADEETPLWMNHRELADIAIRRRLEALTGKPPDKNAKLADMSKQLFDFYDQQRTKKLDAELDVGLTEAKAGKLADAAGRFDRILVQDPKHPRRGEMAEVYLEYGEQLEKAGKLREAATAFGKATGVAPEGPVAARALAKHHQARGLALEKEGKDGAAELQRASEIAATVGSTAEDGDSSWMLYAGIGAAVGGLLLLGWGLAWRRRSRWT